MQLEARVRVHSRMYSKPCSNQTWLKSSQARHEGIRQQAGSKSFWSTLGHAATRSPRPGPVTVDGTNCEKRQNTALLNTSFRDNVSRPGVTGAAVARPPRAVAAAQPQAGTAPRTVTGSLTRRSHRRSRCCRQCLRDGRPAVHCQRAAPHLPRRPPRTGARSSLVTTTCI